MAALRESEWQHIHDRHAGELWRFVLSLTRDREVAEDVVQEVLVRAGRAGDLDGRDESATRAWLFTVARNLVIDRWRSAAVRRERVIDEGGMAALVDGQVRQATPDRTDDWLDRWLIADALASLSKDHRTVLIAAYYEGRTAADIAARLEIAEGTVKSRLHYGLRQLRLALQEKGVTRL